MPLGCPPKTRHQAPHSPENLDLRQYRAHARSAAFHGEYVRLNSEIISSDPKYYRWTQWFFLQFFKHNLAYQKEAPVDFCPNCNTTLAREQVQGEDRHCERCGTPVVRKDLRQWLFRITNYAEELLDFSGIDWPDTIKPSRPSGLAGPKARP
jgi:leucyl-tRNA synthetase